MPVRFFRDDPDTLSLGEQILSALVGAALATAAAGAITSLAYVALAFLI